MTRMNAVLTDYSFPDLNPELAILEPAGIHLEAAQCKTEDEVAALCKNADFVITQFAPVKQKAVEAMQKAKIIVRYGIGVDNVDLAAAASRGVPVCNVPDYCIDEVADHTLAMLLALTRSVVPNWDVIRHERQWRLPVPLSSMRALKIMTVGLVAYGRIAREVALRLKPFKCRVIVFDPAVAPEKIKADGIEPVSLETLLASSDAVSLHCPSTPKTRHLLCTETFSRMKNGVIVVNAGRGDLIRGGDLIEALKSGRVGAAGLDVTEPEPLPADSPLLAMPNVIVSPHVASASVAAVDYLRASVAQMVVDRSQGKPLRNVVNGVAIPH